MIVLAESFPLQLPGAELEILECEAVPAAAKSGEVWATVRLIRYDYSGSITDILEQPVCIARVAAHHQLLREVFERNRKATESLMPGELVFFHELLALTKAFTIEDFTRALLAKKRLGLLAGRG
jgi:hypothetical protein